MMLNNGGIPNSDAIIQAVNNNNYKMVKLLVEKYTFTYNSTMLMIAVMNNNIKIVRLLRDKLDEDNKKDVLFDAYDNLWIDPENSQIFYNKYRKIFKYLIKQGYPCKKEIADAFGI